MKYKNKSTYNFKLLCDDIWNDTIDTNLKALDSNSDVTIPDETKIFLSYANRSIKISMDMLEKNDFVNSLCLLRSSFESILFALAIKLDNEIYTVYKFRNSSIYKKALEKKYKKLNIENSNYKRYYDKKKDWLRPSYIREIVSKNYELIFKEIYENKDDTEKEFKDFYQYLCDYTHPSLSKTFIYMFQKNEIDIDDMKQFYLLNIYYCQLLLIYSLLYLNGIDNEYYMDLCSIMMLLSINSVGDIENIKSKIKKYSDYLYLDIAKDKFKKNDKELKKFEEELKQFKSIENSQKLLNSRIIEVIKNLDDKNFILKYFEIE